MRNPCRTVAVGLGLLTLLLPGITGLGIQYCLEQIQTSYCKLKSENCDLTQRISQSEEEVAQLQAVNSNITAQRDELQERLDDFHEKTDYNKLKSENYNLTQRISQSEEEVAQLQAVNSIITAQRDELQERLDGRTRCPQNWNWHEFGNHCYYVSTSTKTWEESKKDCENRDASLVIIRSAEEQEFIRGLRVGAWIGLVRHEDGVNWEWVDGSPLTTGYWSHNEPSNFQDVQEDCGETFGSDFLWNDEPCGISQSWICKKEI